MSLFVYVYDASGNLVNDPSGSLEYAESISFDSECPGGYGTCTFTVQRDIVMQWAVKQAYNLKVKDGHVTVYQGRVESLDKALETGGSSIQVQALGWRVVLTERKLRKRWIDAAPISRLVWTASQRQVAAQQRFDANIDDDFVLIRGGYGDTIKTVNESFYLDYPGPTGHYIRRVESSYLIRTGEGFTIIYINVADGSMEGYVGSSSGAEVTGTFNETLTGASTNILRIRFRADAADTYDENDRAQVSAMTIYFHYAASHPNYASPTYTSGQILIDVLILVGQTDLSADYDLVTDPAVALAAFATASDKFETGTDIIDRLLALGDASQNSYVCSVWDDTGTSDGKPKVEVKAISTSDWEWEMTLGELKGFKDSPSLDDLENWIIVNWVDEDEQAQCLTPDDNALLKDTTSITAYGERHGEIDAGKATSAEALAMGQRRLAYRKDPLSKAEFVIEDKVRTKQGAWVPVSRMRGGQRLRLRDYQGGVTYFLRSVKYQDGVVTCSPALPPDSLEVFLTRRGSEEMKK